MIRVTVELLPFGSRPAQELGYIEIVNDGTGDREVGNYDVMLRSAVGTLRRHGRITEYCRDQGWGPLVSEALAGFFDSDQA